MINGEIRLQDCMLELRRRLMIAGGCWLGTLVVLFPVASRLFERLAAPLRQALPEGSSLVFLTATEPLFTLLGVAAAAAVIVCLPVVFWQAWAFLANAALHRGRRMGMIFVIAGCLCFLTGAWLGFHFIFPAIFRVLLHMGRSGGLDAKLSMGAYLSLAVKMMLAFGLVFDLPVLMILLTRLGLADRRWFGARRKYMVIVAFVFGAVISPGPDVLSQCSIAIPFVILYEVGILGSGLFGRAGGENRERGETEGRK